MHTRLSSDGEGDFRDWAEWARAHALDFLIFTEHEGDVDPAELAGMPDEVLGVKLFWFLERANSSCHWVELPGLSVLLHPGEPGPPEGKFFAVEAWNMKRDGPYPSQQALGEFSGQGVLFVGGCDLHAPRAEPVILELDAQPTQDSLFPAMRGGNFVSRRGGVTMFPDGRVVGAGLGWRGWECLRWGYRALRAGARATGVARVLRSLRRRK